MRCAVCKRTKEIVHSSEIHYCQDCWSVVSSPYLTLTSLGKEYLNGTDDIEKGLG
jgi:hypothetical protein